MVKGSQKSKLSRELSELFAGFESRASEMMNFSDCERPDPQFSVKEMEGMQKNFSDMQTRLDRRIKRYHNSSTPIGRLADELIVEILRLTLEPWLPLLFSPQKPIGIRDLCSICSRWRNLAINSPVLWSRILLPCPTKTYKLFRDRSKSSPLEICISWDALPLEDKEADLRRAGECLRELAPRISWLQLYCNPGGVGDSDIQPFLATYAGRKEFTRLKYLDLIAPSSFETLSPLNMPSLETLRFDGPLRFIPQSLTHITRLELDCYEHQLFDIVIALEKFPLVEHLCIRTIVPLDEDDEEQNKHHIVTLSNLRSLSVDDIHPSDMEPMLQHLELPPSASIVWGTHEPREEPSQHVSLERMLGSRMSSCYSLQISDVQLASCFHESQYSFTQTINSKNGGLFSVSFGNIEEDVESAALRDLSSYPTELAVLDWQLPWLPSLSILIDVLTSWSSLTQIRICTHEDEFERLLSAIEESPDVVCPVLESLDCTGTRFSGVRMKHFLDFRHTNCRTLRELKISAGHASPPLEDFEPFLGKLIEV
ncbi:hypothetical protein SISSUDRAFT_1123555 [Sistotremastrum suecicum HHB10207 ss-3]|uniref:F-box domain-containing protein n=1 Tax=Sistotremastrum suecicum HHB10207 ss-3 TaxID=1314776 RepID=A0A165XFW4_9AGAM|nr:hypothetical protein SISSUDRAFT_1123555 [Sistotremastrum suecicum HHB10207 ss-3]